ncbi:MAG: metal-dependent hydrolase [Gracilimonas sp.]|uniref:metal-dependent hydrolase n=1 Tax=Gracilimonas sp. TaxID=1974203 RepID=UPI0019C6F699|nr:metal-dependent hydrolase [Gracilimonas sp.]MBD3615932.1 metal-dependent hydrolase [Gracilimonas sp.]
MDPVTHGLIGATASQSFAKKETLRAAAFTGFVSATLADLDVFLFSTTDPLLNLELHRQFTHSLIFIPIGALFATALIWWFVKKHLTLKQTYFFSLAGYATAGMADYLTSYGVHLLWPFVDERYSLNIISVFDPLFTLGIIVCTGIAFWKRDKLFSRIALGWVVLYLIFGFSQKQKAINIAEEMATQNDQSIDRIDVKPTIANQLVWSVRYENQDTLHAYGIRLFPFSDPIIYEGETAPLLDWRNEFNSFNGTILYKDIERFSKLSNGFLIKHPGHENVIGDARYSMLPTTLSPLWGIEIDTTRPDQHVDFGTYRDASPEIRQTFMDMLFGRKLR